MAIVTKQKILEAIRERFGEDTSDETLSLIEDVSDTLEDYEKKSNDTTNWKEKYEENDKQWREKYRARFFEPTKQEEVDDDDDDKPQNLTYENLFKEG